jgi:hypothetical protein
VPAGFPAKTDWPKQAGKVGRRSQGFKYARLALKRLSSRQAD